MSDGVSNGDTERNNSKQRDRADERDPVTATSNTCDFKRSRKRSKQPCLQVFLLNNSIGHSLEKKKVLDKEVRLGCPKKGNRHGVQTI